MPEAPVGRRIEAAIILGGREQADVAAELNISLRTLRRVIGGTREPRDWELGRLAEILPIPEWFLRDGFAGQPSAEELADQQLASIAAALEEARNVRARRHDELVARLDAQDELLRTLLSRVPAGDRASP